MQGLKEAYVKESRADRSNITTVVLSGGEPQYTITIDRRHVIDVPNMYKASYYSISVSPEINGIILFRTISAQGSTICKLVPCLMLSGSLDCAVPYIQKLVDFLYMYNSYMTGKSNQDILIEANRICREFNLSSLKVINTVASLAKGIRLNIRPYLALKNNTYTREEAEEASKSYLAEYRRKFTLFHRRARASPTWSNPGSTRLGRPGRLEAGQGPSQLDLVNCTLLQF